MFRAFFKNLTRNVGRIFVGYNLLWHTLAILLTAVLVLSGFDWWYFESTRNDVLQSFALPAAIIGFFVPIVLSVCMYVAGDIRKNSKLKNAGAATGQASILALVISSTLKAFTGRQQPEFLTHLSHVDISRDFQFGFLKHGVFWGWPSSHTAVAFAGAVSLILLYPKNVYIRYASLIYAVYIGLGVSVSIHWFSDVIAGAILGTVIGFVVERSFKLR